MKRWLIYFVDAPDMKPEVFSEVWPMLERYKQLQQKGNIRVFQECDAEALFTEEVLRKVRGRQ